MASATKAANSKGGDAGSLLKGSDLKASELSVTVFVIAAREAPVNFNAPMILDIEENHGCKAFALNKTNTKKMVELVDDDYAEWAGYEVTLSKVRVQNPATGEPTWGLEIETVRKSKRKAKA